MGAHAAFPTPLFKFIPRPVAAGISESNAELLHPLDLAGHELPAGGPGASCHGAGAYQDVDGAAHTVLLALVMHDDGPVV